MMWTSVTCHDILRDVRRRSFPLINPGSKPLYITSRWSYCKFTGYWGQLTDVIEAVDGRYWGQLTDVIETADGCYWGQPTDVIEDSWRTLLRTADGRYWGQPTDVNWSYQGFYFLLVKHYISTSQGRYLHKKKVFNYTCQGCLQTTLFGHVEDVLKIAHVRDVI